MELTIRCSGLARPMVCAGSLFFKDLPPEEKNAAAEEGTAAGEYLRHLLEGFNVALGQHATNGVPFDDDMAFYCAPIAEEIRSRAGGPILCEQRIDWFTRSGVQIQGQYDVSYVGKDGNLYIDDLKYGYGIVEVKENWQLLGYAIGEVLRRGTPFSKIILRIHQPRPHHEDGPTRAWELSYSELLNYKEMIEMRMSQIAAGEKSLVTSPRCKYCPAAAVCPAFNKAFYNAVEVADQFMQDNISDEHLAKQISIIERIEDIVKIRKGSLTTLAVDRIKKGHIIPGYAMEVSYGNRAWKKGLDPKAVEALTGKKITEQVMLSPAKAEKAGVPKEFVAALVEQPFLGNKLKRKDSADIGNKIFGNLPPKKEI